MTLLTLADAHLAYGHRPLLDGAALALADGERVALVGRNGEGKSSLLKILAGLEAPDDGVLQLATGLTRAYVAQDPQFAAGATVFDAVAEDDPVKLRQALAEGAAVDARDARGRTPLLLAVELGRMEMAKELLEHDANPAVTDAAGLTPLDLARQLRRADIVDLLQRAGARR